MTTREFPVNLGKLIPGVNAALMYRENYMDSKQRDPWISPYKATGPVQRRAAARGDVIKQLMSPIGYELDANYSGKMYTKFNTGGMWLGGMAELVLGVGVALGIEQVFPGAISNIAEGAAIGVTSGRLLTQPIIGFTEIVSNTIEGIKQRRK